MLQRVQTIYLIIFIFLSGAMITGVSVLEFQATGTYISEIMVLDINCLNIEGSGELNLPDSQSIQEFSKNIANQKITFDTKNQLVEFKENSPLLIVQILLVVFGLLTIFSYKNLKKQLNFARATFFLTLLYVLGVMALVYFSMDIAKPYVNRIPIDDMVVSRHTSLGFYLICLMLPFAYLAQLGIKRDLNLIRSLDRLR
jgi:hypothetical protein